MILKIIILVINIIITIITCFICYKPIRCKKKSNNSLAKEKYLLIEQLHTLEQQIEEKRTLNETMKILREEELDNILAEEKKFKTAQLQAEIDEWAKDAQECASQEFEREQKSKTKILDSIRSEIQDYSQIREALNQDIMRNRQINEDKDFYTIQLDDKANHDLQLLESIRSQLIQTDNFNKLIYDNYIARPCKEMIKRVLSGQNPSGIYKVTNIQTQEVYIGKSVKIADRFQNHVKSAYGLEGLADSQFQRALKKYGITQFYWELLEKVPKENLTDREKYYIKLFDTKRFGYNQREG